MTTLTVDTRGDWLGGKVQETHTAVVDGALSIADGFLSVDYWESRTVQLRRVSNLTVRTQIPAPKNSSVTVRVITSDTPDFTSRSGAYRRTGEQAFTLTNGTNTFAIGRLSDDYYRIHLTVTRTDPSVPAPQVDGRVVTALRDKDAILYP